MKDVDLVIYQDGVRKVIGEACVNDDGTAAEVKVIDEVTLNEVLANSNVFATSLGPFREDRQN